MKHTPYQPIACGLHEIYQLAAMKKRQIILAWRGDGGEKEEARVILKDVFTQAQAEYLKVVTEAGEQHEIRLDKIVSAVWAETGEALHG